METRFVEGIGALALLLIGIIGYLLDQRNKQVNETLKELQDAVAKLTESTKGSNLLHEFTNDRLKVIESENGTLRRSLYNIDLWVASMTGNRPPKFPTPGNVRDERAASD